MSQKPQPPSGAQPRMPSPFQKFHGGIAGRFEITGDFPSVSDEQRRQLLVELLQKMFNESGWPDITIERLVYSPLFEIGVSQEIARYSQVKIDLIVPVFVDDTGRRVVKMNVPPTGDWSLEVIRRILLFMQRWIENLPARP